MRLCLSFFVFQDLRVMPPLGPGRTTISGLHATGPKLRLPLRAGRGVRPERVRPRAHSQHTGSLLFPQLAMKTDSDYIPPTPAGLGTAMLPKFPVIFPVTREFGRVEINRRLPREAVR